MHHKYGIRPDHLRRLVKYVLIGLDLYSDAAVELLIGTAAQETLCGHYLYQLGGGPGRGIYQMEPATEADIWQNFLRYRGPLAARVTAITGRPGPGPWLTWDLAYQTAMTRIHYLRVPSPLPPPDDLPALADYWKTHYNTSTGAGLPAEFIRNFPA